MIGSCGYRYAVLDPHRAQMPTVETNRARVCREPRTTHPLYRGQVWECLRRQDGALPRGGSATKTASDSPLSGRRGHCTGFCSVREPPAWAGVVAGVAVWVALQVVLVLGL